MPPKSPSSSEYFIPDSAERRLDATELSSDDQLDFHASKLDRLTASALGAATQTAQTVDTEDQPAHQEQESPESLIRQYGSWVLQMRTDRLDGDLFAEQVKPSYLTEDSKRDDFTLAA